MTALIEARGVSRSFDVGRSWIPGSGQTLQAVDKVDLQVQRGEVLGLVGESGSGKSTLGRCLARLLDVTDGEVLFDGQDVTRLKGSALRPFRRRVQMIFQDPSSSLNPQRRIGDILAEPLVVHHIRPKDEINARLQELMTIVGLPATALDRFPHQFSGGQRQRIGIARALAMEPDLIIADEPVSALDVSVQAQVMNLFADLRERLNLTYLFIAHDLGVVRQVSDRVAIMYLGSIMETGTTDTVFDAPAHPYTKALISAIPVPEVNSTRRKERMVLTGEIPSPTNPPKGCKFVTRCPFAQDLCRKQRPLLKLGDGGRQVACHFPLAAISS